MLQSQLILVGGGTGFVGRHLVNLLRTCGAKVKIITSRQSNSADHITWSSIKGQGLPLGTTAVVNLAGRNILDPVLWTESFKREVYTSRIETNNILVKAIHGAQNKPRAFVTVSGVGYYEFSDTVEYDEAWTQPDTLPNNGNYLMRLARDWEASSVLNEQEAPNTRRVVIRSGVVLGHDGGLVKNIWLPFKLGLGGPIGTGKQWFPWIHVDDLASMFKFAITDDHVTGIINGVAPEQVRNLDFARTFANQLGRPSIIPMPKFAVNLIFGSERGDILLNGQRVRSRASSLGFDYRYSNLIDACRDCLKAR